MSSTGVWMGRPWGRHLPEGLEGGIITCCRWPWPHTARGPVFSLRQQPPMSCAMRRCAGMCGWVGGGWRGVVGGWVRLCARKSGAPPLGGRWRPRLCAAKGGAGGLAGRAWTMCGWRSESISSHSAVKARRASGVIRLRASFLTATGVPRHSARCTSPKEPLPVEHMWSSDAAGIGAVMRHEEFSFLLAASERLGLSSRVWRAAASLHSA